MTAETRSPTMLVRLSEKTVARLMALRAGPDEAMDRVVARLAARPPITPHAESTAPSRKIRPVAVTVRGKRAAEVLGERIEAPTFGLLFAAIVDMVAELDPTVLERLAAIIARKRHYVARSKAEIHPGRPDLPTIKTRSGWWVSRNVGARDVQRGLMALCRVGSLTFGTDVRFPLR